jgi:tRNA modification GTPase
MADRSTIFALSSGRPPAAIGVVRVSGPQACTALERLTGRLPKPRQAALVRVRDPASGEAIDEAVVLWFPAPHSETGEDVAEVQLHGGQAVIAAVLKALAAIDGCRLAEPGEFTRRAFEHGKLDLTAVEGLGDLIFAETPAQRRQAFRQLKGLIGDRAEAWRARLIEALALIEARIDFSDEANVPENLIAPAADIVGRLRDEIAAALADGQRGERLREGLVVAIAGPPNAGKSTLFNRLARREAAIVSPYAGTTRDVIEVHLEIGGYPLTILDTAGIRDSSEPVEQEGIRRARTRAAEADLVLWVTDPSAGDRTGRPVPQLSKEAPHWLIENKLDLLAARSTDQTKPDATTAGQKNEAEFIFLISATRGDGVEALFEALSRFVRDYFAGGETAIVTRERHRRALAHTVAALERALAEAQHRDPREELIAEELRQGTLALGRLTGRVDVEDVLDKIFRDFCIGK